MKRLSFILVITALAAIPLFAQKIERETSDRTQIIHLKTALNHLTVIELREPVIQVATGSQSFKVAWRESKVFVQPTESDASTNLFIWTASERLNYELEPAGDVAGMDFAVDQIPLVQPKPASAAPPPQPSPAEVLLAGKPVRIESRKPSHKPIEITIRDLYEGDGRVLVRYSLRNRSNHIYDVNTPKVYELTGARYPESLYSLVDSQLGDQEATRINAGQQIPVPVIEAHVQTERLVPGQESLGVVALHLPSSTQPTILRFQFANVENEPIAALLVR